MNDSLAFELISFIVMFSIVIGLIAIIVIYQWVKDKQSPRVVTLATIADQQVQK